jgi:hypothetical protein
MLQVGATGIEEEEEEVCYLQGKRYHLAPGLLWHNILHQF